MRIVQWGFALGIVAIGGIVTVLIFLENGLAGTITGIMVLLCSFPLLLATKAKERTDRNIENGKNIGITAAALRQGRAISRLDDGEISGAGGRSL
ncbi:MAG: hypothetical protein KUG59_06650 [Parvibaculaceae bacterium]|nr:hypothetical protein [Parvibaculaceae bacterium]